MKSAEQEEEIKIIECVNIETNHWSAEMRKGENK